MKHLETTDKYVKVTNSFFPHIGIAAKESLPLDYSKEWNLVRIEEKEILSKITGIDKKNIHLLRQVHEDTIIHITEPSFEDKSFSGIADGIITTVKNSCVVIRTADCVPLFAYDNRNNILGAAHSGWRSTQLKIASKLVQTMHTTYNSSYEDISVIILPSIGPDSYEVQMDVAQHFEGYYTNKSGKILLNLWKHIEDSLIEAGVSKENIYFTEVCNLIHNDTYFSHRCGDAGRNLNFGVLG